MTAERGFALHPLAARDITEIWEDIAEDNRLRRVVSAKKFSAVFAPWFHFPSGHTRPASLRGPCAFFWCVNI